ISFAAADYTAIADQSDPLAALDLTPLEDAAMDLLEPDFRLAEDDPPYDEQLMLQVRTAAREALKTLRPRIEAGLDEVEPVLARLFPHPTGFDGFLYTLRTSL